MLEMMYDLVSTALPEVFGMLYDYEHENFAKCCAISFFQLLSRLKFAMILLFLAFLTDSEGEDEHED